VAGRTDNVTDPALAAQLLSTRRGQAYYSRKLNDLSDKDFDAPTLLTGWSRRELIAHVGLNARALTRLVNWAATGVETPMYVDAAQRDADIALAATLPPQALRNLSDHAAIHLNVEWRDLPEDAWRYQVRTAQGRTVPVSQTVWMRSREVWIHAVDLDTGGSFVDFPAKIIDALLADVGSAWDRRRQGEAIPRYRFEPTDRRLPTVPARAGQSVVVLRGPAAQLAAWATGRPAVGVSRPDGLAVPPAPRWL